MRRWISDLLGRWKANRIRTRAGLDFIRTYNRNRAILDNGGDYLKGPITMIRSRCECGKVKAKDSRTCNTCHKDRMAGFKTIALSHVQRGTCPDCGTKLIRNTSLAGWFQCGAYACEAMRKPEFIGLPSCGFQCSTE